MVTNNVKLCPVLTGTRPDCRLGVPEQEGKTMYWDCIPSLWEAEGDAADYWDVNFAEPKPDEELPWVDPFGELWESYTAYQQRVLIYP